MDVLVVRLGSRRGACDAAIGRLLVVVLGAESVC